MNQISPKTIVRNLRIIVLAILSTSLLFLAIAIVITDGPSELILSVDDPMILVLLIMTLLIVPVSIILPKQQLQKIKSDDPLNSKLTILQTAVIMRAAIWEGIYYFSIVVFIVSGNLLPLLIGIPAIMIILGNYPSMSRLKTMLSLNEEEMSQLR